MPTSALNRTYDETYSCQELKLALRDILDELDQHKKEPGPISEKFRRKASTVPDLMQFKSKSPRNIKSPAIQNKILHSVILNQGTQSFEQSILTLHQNGLAIARDLESGHIYEAIQVTQGSLMALAASPGGGMIATGGLSCTVDLFPVNEALEIDMGIKRPAHEFNYEVQQQSKAKPYLETTPTLQTTSKGTQYISKAPNTIQLQRELARNDPKQALESASFAPRVTHPSRYVPPGYNNFNNFCASFIGHQSSISSIEFLNEYQVCSGSADGALMVWDTDSGVATNLYRSHVGSVNGIKSVSPQSFITVGSEGYVMLWDTRAHEPQMTFSNGIQAPLNFVDKAARPEIFMAAGRNHIDIFDLRSGDPLINYTTQNHTITSVGVSRSGRAVLTGSSSGRCVILDFIKGRPLGEVAGHSGTVCGSHFSGPSIITTGHDGTVKHWTQKKK